MDGRLSDATIKMLNEIGAQLAFGDGVDDVGRKFTLEDLLELEFEILALRLLRALLYLPFELPDSASHGYYGLILFHDWDALEEYQPPTFKSENNRFEGSNLQSQSLQ